MHSAQTPAAPGRLEHACRWQEGGGAGAARPQAVHGGTGAGHAKHMPPGDAPPFKPGQLFETAFCGQWPLLGLLGGSACRRGPLTWPVEVAATRRPLSAAAAPGSPAQHSLEACLALCSCARLFKSLCRSLDLNRPSLHLAPGRVCGGRRCCGCSTGVPSRWPQRCRNLEAITRTGVTTVQLPLSHPKAAALQVTSGARGAGVAGRQVSSCIFP